jgi:soluble lytic murein transglycosylase-like protein
LALILLLNKHMNRKRTKSVVLHIVVVALIYAVCFWVGRHLEAQTSPQDIKFHDVIAEAAKSHNVHPALIAAVIHAESNFNPRARSHAGAAGLMQINPPTRQYLRLKNVYNPRQNVEAGTRYLRELMDRFDGDVVLALAAYNAGPGAVMRYDGVPPYSETQAYVKKVLAFYDQYRNTFVSNPLMS